MEQVKMEGKLVWKPGTMIYPLPAVLVSCGDKQGNSNILTIAWTGILCSDPAIVYISVRPERYSRRIIRESGEFVINLTTEKLAYATDFCGVRSGRDVDKWKECNLTPMEATKVYAPIIAESPVNIECKVMKMERLGSHDMFMAEVIAVDVSEECVDEKGRFDINACNLITFAHGAYYSLKEMIGTFGYTVRKKP